MSRKIENPVTVVKEVFADKVAVTTHPAFAQIGAHRVSGSTNLYDSDFRHNHYMTIRISHSELHRRLNRDWHFARDEIIEVALSESQWATFVSATNMGDGVPCTLQRVGRDIVPGLPEPDNRADQFSSELSERLHNTVERVNRLIVAIDGMGLSKSKSAAEMKRELTGLLTELKSNLPFVAETFEKHVEDTVESAKQEIHGYMTNVVQRAGLEAITGGALPLQIEHIPEQE